MSFHLLPRFGEKLMKQVHEAPAVMTIPLLLLGAGAISSGFLLKDWFVGDASDDFWRSSIFVEDYHTALEDAHHSPRWVESLPLFLSVSGIATGFLCYQIFTSLPSRLARAFRPLYRFLFASWYFDRLYNFLFLRSVFAFARMLWHGVDQKTIDAFGPDGISFVANKLGGRLRAMQSGYVYHYVFAILTGVVLFGAFAIFQRLRF